MSKQYQDILQNLKENLFALEERISQYVYETDIPLQDLRERDRLKRRIAQLELQLQVDVKEVQDIVGKADVYLVSLDGIANQLTQYGWNEEAIQELDEWAVSIEVSKQTYEKAIKNSNVDSSKEKRSLLLLLRQTDRLFKKYEQIAEYVEAHPVSSVIAFSNIIPPQNFTDREEILQDLEENFNKYNVVVIAGVGGIGKTYLIKQFISFLKDYSTLWIDCTSELSLEQFFFTIDEVLVKDYGIITIGDILRSTDRLTENKIALLLRQLDRHQICIIIDDFHTANDELEPIARFIQKYTKNIKCIIATRRFRRSLRNMYYSIYEENLSGISIHHVREYLQQYRLSIKEELVQPIYERTAGHPLALRMFASLCVVERYTPEELLNEFANVFGQKLEIELITKIFQDLQPQEVDLLSRLSVFRFSFRRDAVVYIYNQDDALITLNSLLYRFLITEPIEKDFLTHDLIREFFYDKLELEDKLMTHHRAGNHYLEASAKTKDINDKLEAYYHFYKANKYDEALNITFDVAEQLETEAQFELILEMISQMEVVLEKMPAKLLTYKARVLEIWGRWNESLGILEDVIDTPDLETETLLTTLNTMLLIYDQRGEYEQGLALFKKYQSYTQASDRTAELAHLYHRVGRFYHEWNDYEQTLEYYNKSLEISVFLDDKKNVIRTKRLIGVTSWFFGHYDEALEQLTECQDMCRTDNNQRELSDTLKHIGIVWTKKEEYEKALPFFEESLEINTRIGYKQGMGWITMQFADAYIPLNRLTEAEATLNKALKIFQELSEKNGIVNTTYRIGRVYMKQGEFDKALETYTSTLDLAKELGSPIWEGMILEGMTEMYEMQDKKEKAIESLSEAMKIYEAVGSQRVEILKEQLNKLKTETNSTVSDG